VPAPTLRPYPRKTTEAGPKLYPHPPCRIGAGPLWIQILAVGVQIHRFWALAAARLRAAKDAPWLAACAEVHAPVDVWVDLGADRCVSLAPDCHTCPTVPRTPPPAAWRPLRLYSILCTVSTWFRGLVMPLVRDARSGRALSSVTAQVEAMPACSARSCPGLCGRRLRAGRCGRQRTGMARREGQAAFRPVAA
jgi:hypothetical protein